MFRKCTMLAASTAMLCSIMVCMNATPAKAADESDADAVLDRLEKSLKAAAQPDEKRKLLAKVAEIGNRRALNLAVAAAGEKDVADAARKAAGQIAKVLTAPRQPPYVRRSAERLWEIGMHAEQQGNINLALIATRTIRRSFYAARSFYTPGTDWIKKCDVKIEEFTGIEQADLETCSRSAGPRKLRPANQEATAPSALWSVVVEIGFLGWVGCTIGFIIFACKEDRQARFFTPHAITWGAVTLIFFVVWLVGMIKA